MHIAQLLLLSPALLVAAQEITAAPCSIHSPAPERRDNDSLMSILESKSSSVHDKLESKSSSIQDELSSKSTSIAEKLSSKSDSIVSKIGGDPTGNSAPSVTSITDSSGNVVSTSAVSGITPNAAFATGVPLMAGGLVGAGLAAVALL